MINEYIRYEISAEHHAAFVNAYSHAAEFLRASSVCEGYELSQCEEAGDCFILRIVWTSTDDHLGKFRGSDEFKGFLAAIKPYISNIQEMRHYAPTPVQWTRTQ